MKKILKSRKKFSIEYFRALVAIAMADAKLSKEEIEFFELKASELGFAISSLQDMYSIDIDELLDTKNVDIEDVDFITDIIAMAMIDGQLHQKEYDLCISLAKRKGFTKKDVDDTIKLLNEFINEQNINHENN